MAGCIASGKRQGTTETRDADCADEQLGLRADAFPGLDLLEVMIDLRSLGVWSLFVLIHMFVTWTRVTFLQHVWGKTLCHAVFSSLAILMLGAFMYPLLRGNWSVFRLLRLAPPGLILSTGFLIYVMRHSEEVDFGIPVGTETVVTGLFTMSLAVVFLLYGLVSGRILAPWAAREKEGTEANTRIHQFLMALHAFLNGFGLFLFLVTPRSAVCANFGLCYFLLAPPLMGATLWMVVSRFVFESRVAVLIALGSTILLVPGWCISLLGVDQLLFPFPS